MDKTLIGYLKTRWGLEWIRLRRSPLKISVYSSFRVNEEYLRKYGYSAVLEDGIASLSSKLAGSMASLQRQNAGLYQISYTTSVSPARYAILSACLEKQITELGADLVVLKNIGIPNSSFKMVYPTDCLTEKSYHYNATLEQDYSDETDANFDAFVIIDIHPENGETIHFLLKCNRV